MRHPAEVDTGQQRRLHHRVVGFGVIGRDRTFVPEEEDHPTPVEVEFSQVAVHRPRRRATGKDQRSGAAADGSGHGVRPEAGDGAGIGKHVHFSDDPSSSAPSLSADG